MSEIHPHKNDLRQAILSRSAEFTRLTGKSRTEIGLSALNDGAFIGQVEDGRRFRIDTYQRVMDWLEQNWPEPAEGSME